MSGLILDARWLNTGIGTYTANLLQEYHTSGLEFGLITQSQHVKTLAALSQDIRVVNAGMYSLREQVEMPWATRNDEVLHVMHYNAPLARSGTMLVTILDLTHILDHTHRRGWKSLLYARPMLNAVVRRASHLFTISEYSKQQIVEHLGISPSNVTVAHLGVSSAFFPEPREAARSYVAKLCGFDGPYILFVGSLKPHKNLDGLIRAYARLEEKYNLGRKLLIVGSGHPGLADLRRSAEQAKVTSKVIVLSNVTIDELRRIYSGADVTALPSYEEGFGLPVVESMACGTPVACSQRASLPEIGGEAAAYFDPYDTESIASALLELLSSKEKWTLHQSLGFSNARRFSWSTCAQRHVDVYRGYLPAACFESYPQQVVREDPATF